MPRPVKCVRCGHMSLTTARKGTKCCQHGKKRSGGKVISQGCIGRKREVSQEEYDRWLIENEDE
tara:strand:+ start:805 stop:996 length:192 start_codon:yes stop_codon:yes gene_type:complete